ncbi:MAG TPA: M48 family metallopeptidase [Ktedonobacteraceae bacterium]|nr:M48 family metallopeptidase [Ktedonobacteraceae bacterium]
MSTDIEQSPTEPSSGVELDAARQQQAREYARIRRQLSLTSLGIAALGILFIFMSGFDVALRDWLQPLGWQPVSGWYPVQVLVFLLVLSLAYEIVTTPLGYYGFSLSRRYGLSTMTAKGWLADLCKGLGIGLVFEVAAAEVVYLLLAAQPQLWWLWVAIALLFFTVIMANLAPVLILPLFYKFTPLPDGELKERLLALTDRAHTRVRGVFTMHLSSKTTAANAALMGLGNTRRIVLGDTLLDRYTPDEIEVVLAHELGHHVHRDLWKLIVSQSVIMLVGLYLVSLALNWAANTQHYYLALADPATMPFLLLLLGIFGLVVLPLSNGISRAVEYQADEYALQSTRKVEAFKSAMTRLANQNLSEVEPSPAVEFFFYDHPAVGKRLQHADRFAGHHNP